MNQARRLTVAGVVAVTVAGGTPACQQPRPLAIGEAAPEFALRAATQDGVLPEPVRLGDFRDQTVVIAFFYRARTRG
jgi:hypothetical protein